MAKSVQNVKNSLKFKAQEKEGVLSVKVGVKKFTVPVKARMLSDHDYLFLSFSASSELYRVDGKELSPLTDDAEASTAFESLNPGKKRGGGGRRSRGGVEMPDLLAEALKNLPAGYRLGYGTDGSPKLVRTRKRKG